MALAGYQDPKVPKSQSFVVQRLKAFAKQTEGAIKKSKDSFKLLPKIWISVSKLAQ